MFNDMEDSFAILKLIIYIVLFIRQLDVNMSSKLTYRCHHYLGWESGRENSRRNAEPGHLSGPVWEN